MNAAAAAAAEPGQADEEHGLRVELGAIGGLDPLSIARNKNCALKPIRPDRLTATFHQLGAPS
jgi:hypothetical protein